MGRQATAFRLLAGFVTTSALALIGAAIGVVDAGVADLAESARLTGWIAGAVGIGAVGETVAVIVGAIVADLGAGRSAVGRTIACVLTSTTGAVATYFRQTTGPTVLGTARVAAIGLVAVAAEPVGGITIQF